jgi:hypothetical protein
MEHMPMGFGRGFDRSSYTSHSNQPQESSSTEKKFTCGSIDKKDKSNKQKYCFETFEAPQSEFEGKFSEFLNSRYENGWEYEDCQYSLEGNRQIAYCVFEED